MKSMSRVPDSEDIFLLKRVDNQDILIKLTEQLDLLICSYGFFVAMQFPCEHILRILTQKRKEEEVIKYHILIKDGLNPENRDLQMSF